MKLLNYQPKYTLDLHRGEPSNSSIIKLKKEKIEALIGKGRILELIGKWQESQKIREKALYLAEKIDDKNEMGQVYEALGWLSGRKCDYNEAIIYYQKAMKLFEITNNKSAIIKVAKGMGVVYYYKGDHDMAITYYNKSLKFANELDDKQGIAKIANNVGDLFRTEGYYEAALAYFEKCIKIHEEINNIDKKGIAIVTGNIGLVHTVEGNYDMAIEYYDRAISIVKGIGNQYVLTYFLIEKANTFFSLERFDEAQILNIEGLEIAEEIGNKEYIFKGKILSAKIDFALKKENAPKQLYEILKDTEDEIEITTLHYELWKMNEKEEHYQSALEFYQRLYEKTPNIEYKNRIEELINER